MARVLNAHSSAERVCWRFNLIDGEGSWCVRPEQWPELIAHLSDFESMTMNELFAKNEEPGKVYDLADRGFPVKEANDRWQAMRLDDQDHVCRLRHGGAKRIYGLRVDNVFHLIWWDPEHKVWPSKNR